MFGSISSIVSHAYSSVWRSAGTKYIMKLPLSSVSFYTRKRIKDEIVILSPPALFLRLPGERHELNAARLADLVEIAQIPDIAESRTVQTSVEPADLGGRPLQALRHLVDGKTARAAQPTKLFAEFALAEHGTIVIHHGASYRG
jgi:hypothetical protein